MKELPIFITGNEKKVREIKQYLGFELPHQKIDLVEIQSLDLEEVVEYKAREAFSKVGKPVLVEDTSLTFNALGKLPGPLIKWFLQELSNEGMCRLLDGYTDRSAVAEVRFGYCNGEKVEQFHGIRKGRIIETPKGPEGFGWDPIFIPEGQSKTWGEMNDEEKMHTSMRKIALEKVAEFLKEQ